jgi:hypothetical protein
MGLIIILLVAIVIFALLWYAIGIIPFPQPLANIRWVLYILLILIAVLWLVQTFLGGVPGLK